MGDYTDLLYARPTFVGGIARCLDFGATLREFNSSPNGDQADQVALASDWQAIGDDLRAAILKYAADHEVAEQLHVGE
jgi:hypothetical protein